MKRPIVTDFTETIYRADAYKYTQEQEKYIDYLEALNEAINYTQCCTELKDKEVLSFEEWLFVNNYKKLFDYFVKDSISFTESELMQIYNDKVMSL